MATPLLLEDLSVLTAATITAIDRGGIDPDTARRLHELGFDEGVDIELLHRAPFGGDPLAVRVGNMVVALRRSMARLIEIETAAVAAR
ncbi:FeoA family protein [Polymorphobacter fuscus]|uniref:Ferrous iron transport protein A n=1 Tax=Sandarakinorhabdus fusca TaxID=1439888 RepID=A0A7C9KXD9_9SPHN|nr:FeoA family protein [Polymorphobacter fuscus]KAB7646538.1 ferrous iron transport protein A [Polymorphobacter fuscus]MQT17785.1 ferrous iron transport protein A [Polymorphobacter fuscus]NJC09667.1 ferrous iron transport protein A [Polymorphobacter fuscus]